MSVSSFIEQHYEIDVNQEKSQVKLQQPSQDPLSCNISYKSKSSLGPSRKKGKLEDVIVHNNYTAYISPHRNSEFIRKKFKYDRLSIKTIEK